MRLRRSAVCAAALAVAVIAAKAQEREDRALLPWEQMRAIIAEASGDRAMHHLLELVPYPRVRPLPEYQGHFRESETMARFAKEYGYGDVRIESFPSPQRLWQPTVGELWMVEPELRKLYDIQDVAVSLATNSASGDVTAELIDLASAGGAADVKGKIVLSATGLGAFAGENGAAARGAAGIVGIASIRPDDYPDQIVASGVTVPQGGSGFGWAVSPRVGRELAARLARGQKVVLRSVVKAETFPGELEVVHATIPGDGTTDQEVVVSAHLYEGYIKQGANDDNSGCALTLEMGRAYLQLIREGRLPKPKRTIRFLWVPEISGTNAWLDKYPDVVKRVVADLNFDMEGLRLTTSNSFWVLHRTPDTFPSFLNDVAQNMMEFVAELNRERVRFRSNGYAFTYPVVSPNGSRDPFYIKIDKHYGASDHVTYMQRGIPSVMFITWPDMWYHSSHDTPDKQDPTQYKRAAVVGVGAMAVLARGGDPLAATVTSENLGRGVERMGEAHTKGASYLADARGAAALVTAWKEARNAVRHQAAVEKAVVRSGAVLYDDPAAAAARLGRFDPLIDRRAAALQEELDALYAMLAARTGEPTGAAAAPRGLTGTTGQGRRAPPGAPPGAEPPSTDLERRAAQLIVERVPAAGGRGAGGGRGGGGGGRGGAAGASGPAIPQHMTAELNILLGQKRTVLEIRDFLSGEFEPLPLETLMDYLKSMEARGAVKLIEKPPSAAPRPKR